MSTPKTCCSIDDLLAEPREQIERLTPEEAFAAAQGGAVLVDVRSEDERHRQGVWFPAPFAPPALGRRLEARSGRFDCAADDVGGVDGGGAPVSRSLRIRRDQRR